MTRKRAREMCESIKAYLCAGNPIWNTEVIAEAMDMAIDALDVPDTNVGKWISCSERLPKLYQKVLVTIYGDIELAERTDYTSDESVCWVTDYGSYYPDGDSEIKVWQPCPKPYIK